MSANIFIQLNFCFRGVEFKIFKACFISIVIDKYRRKIINIVIDIWDFSSISVWS